MKQSAICVVTSSLGLFIANAGAQGQTPWRLELNMAPVASHYEENPAEGTGPDLTGNSFSALPLRLDLTYSLTPQYRLPFWIGVQGEIPLLSSAGTEVGRLARNGVNFTVQQEYVTYRRSILTSSIGFEILPVLQPFLTYSVSRETVQRTGQMDGQPDGTLLPDPNQDYTETINEGALGVGLISIISLMENASSRLRITASYRNIQRTTVSNTYFDAGEWGQHTTGYELEGRIAFEHAVSLFPQNFSYLSCGVDVSLQKRNGDGNVGYDVFERPYWPANTMRQLGAFIGFGLFF